MECPICLEKDKWITETPCNHKLCISCIIELKENRCPFCRKKKVFNSLPFFVKRVSKMFSNNNNTKTISTNQESNINVDSYFDFPPLG